MSQPPNPPTGISATPEWKALNAHFEQIKDAHMRDLFAADDKRFDKMSLQFEDILFDFSKNRVTEETMALLRSLANAADVQVKGCYPGCYVV